MPQSVHILSQGNSKLGRRVHTFSIPAGDTCPGQSPVCAAHCYATAGHFRRDNVKAAYARNWVLAQRDDFVHQVVGEIRDRDIRLLRLHVSGDFYSPAYCRKWVEVARLCHQTRIWAYTRSWRVPAIASELAALADLPNVRLWYSSDRDTGAPTERPARVKVAWMQSSADERPGCGEVVFRVATLRAKVVKRIGLALVCPPENGATGHGTDCGKCGVCWQ